MVFHKLRNVPDSVCEGCAQCWRDECRAYQMPHSEEERKQRLEKRFLACEDRKDVE